MTFLSHLIETPVRGLMNYLPSYSRAGLYGLFGAKLVTAKLDERQVGVGDCSRAHCLLSLSLSR